VSRPASRPRLFVSHDADYDYLTALEFGRVDDGQPPDRWREVTEVFHFLLDKPGGREVGFRIDEFSAFGLNRDGVSALRSGPRFDVPQLALRKAGAARIGGAATRFFAGQNSVNRDFFERATECGANEMPEQALYWWRCCLQAGDPMAHFGIGYTLCDLGRPREGLKHLEHYVRIAPHHPWNWVWLGKCLEALDRIDDARSAYRRAIGLTEGGCDETDAPELLAALGP
jgi:tetratricopeptide (TPR) repeat protein